MVRKLEQFNDFEKPFAIMSVGIPGSGKSTIVREIAARLDIPVVSSDGTREKLTGDASDITQDALIPGAMDEETETILGSGKSVIIDATHTNPEVRRLQIQKCRDLGAVAVIAFVCDVPLETAIERNGARERVVPLFVLKNKAEELENTPVTPDDGFDRVINYSDWGFILDSDNTATNDKYE